MRRFANPASLAVAVCYLAAVPPLWAVDFGQIDDFQDGTAQGWFHAPPSPVPPSNVADAGPAGAGDNALFVEATGGGGPGSRLLARNLSQWTGDYTAAGINAIAMDLLNPNPVQLDMRIAIARVDDFGTWLGRYVSTDPVTIAPALPGTPPVWQSVVFPLTAPDLTQIGIGDDAAAVLADVGEVRLLHNPAPDWKGAVIVGEFLADNIRAIPEPSTAVLAVFLIGLGILTPSRSVASKLSRRR